MLELTVEASTIEKIFRIEHTLDLFHDRKVAAWFRPECHAGLRGPGREFDNGFPPSFYSGREASGGGFVPREPSAHDPRCRVRVGGALNAGEGVAALGERGGNPHH